MYNSQIADINLHEKSWIISTSQFIIVKAYQALQVSYGLRDSVLFLFGRSQYVRLAGIWREYPTNFAQNSLNLA